MTVPQELIEKIQRHVEDGVVCVQKHPDLNLFIYNYTPKAQYGRVWDEASLMCRGLILDNLNNVIARPFPKFFNLEEHQGTLPDGRFDVFEKYDGSLGIMYMVNGEPRLATRGSFMSDQAIEGTRMLQAWVEETRPVFKDGVTYLFEIIYPENRIVVDYKGKRGLVYLAAIDNATGVDIDHELPIETAKRYDGILDIASLKALETKNAEGFVIRWENGQRLKVKFAEYCRLHKLLTGVTERTILELLKEGHGVNELLDRVPDEFYEWVKVTTQVLKDRYETIEAKARRTIHEELLGTMTRKDAALLIMKKYPDVATTIFSMLDERPYANGIWKRLKPEAVRPFRNDEV